MSKKIGLVASLRARGFDTSKPIPFEKGAHVGCSQCQAVCINGIPCHETGCPNEAKARKATELTEVDDGDFPGIHLDHIPDEGECQDLLDRFVRKGYWPDVYHVNERGNVDLLSIGQNGATIVESWV